MMFITVYSHDSMTRSLRLARCDTDFLMKQVIQQRRFTHIRTTHYSDVAAAAG